jgi:hypothetical protein
LSIFEEATKLLSGDKYVTLTLMMPIPQFPKLSSVAREALAIPCSSVSVERVFNDGRDIIGIRRSSLNPETISAFMFGNHYMK